jgi:hypothetical protein
MESVLPSWHVEDVRCLLTGDVHVRDSSVQTNVAGAKADEIVEMG